MRSWFVNRELIFWWNEHLVSSMEGSTLYLVICEIPQFPLCIKCLAIACCECERSDRNLILKDVMFIRRWRAGKQNTLSNRKDSCCPISRVSAHAGDDRSVFVEHHLLRADIGQQFTGVKCSAVAQRSGDRLKWVRHYCVFIFIIWYTSRNQFTGCTQ